MSYQCKILCDSIGPTDIRLTTFQITYPRFVHAELLTHRMLSRNSASSRAIPVTKTMAAVWSDTVRPVHWGANQPGMQAVNELTGDDLAQVEAEWNRAASSAVRSASRMHAHNAHKQIVNRLIEPFAWITTIVTATEWANFFALRCHPDAQPELRVIAEMMRSSYEYQTPTRLLAGQWHMPLVDQCDRDQYTMDDLTRISAGRCARVSYLTHDGRRDPMADIALCTRLVDSGHMSPLEHVARALARSEWHDACQVAAAWWELHGVPTGNLRGWAQLRKQLAGEHAFSAPKDE